jgi:mono/diheme cytochrome c family protein
MMNRIFVYSGVYNVAATKPHKAVVRWMLNTIQEQSVRHHAQGVTVSLPTDPEVLQTGYQLYVEMCEPCHGAPGVEPAAIGQGLHPGARPLSEKATFYTTEELYWITENGIKSTGMPAFGPTLSREDLLAIIAFMEQLPEISAQEYKAMGEADGRKRFNKRVSPARRLLHESGPTGGRFASQRPGANTLAKRCPCSRLRVTGPLSHGSRMP